MPVGDVSAGVRFSVVWSREQGAVGCVGFCASLGGAAAGRDGGEC